MLQCCNSNSCHKANNKPTIWGWLKLHHIASIDRDIEDGLLLLGLPPLSPSPPNFGECQQRIAVDFEMLFGCARLGVGFNLGFVYTPLGPVG